MSKKKKKTKYYIYQYRNKDNEVIYVGLTKRPIKNRIKEHEVEELQKETHHILYAEVHNEISMHIYEIFYINKYHPKFNSVSVYPDHNEIELPELTFIPYLTDETERVQRRILGNKRIYSVFTDTGIVDVILTNPFESKEKQDIKIETYGTPTLSKKDMDNYMEVLCEVYGDVYGENEKII
jgi:hypothetical protein